MSRLIAIKSRVDCNKELIFIDGLMTEHKTNPIEWKNALECNYLECNWTYLRWSSSTHWWQAQKNSIDASDMLTELIFSSSNKSFILFGFSLGANVIRHSLGKLGQTKKRNIIEVNLLGGATTNSKDWITCLPPVSGKIYNYFSKNDDILKTLYKVGSGFDDPIGLSPIKILSNKIVNVDVSNYVGGHGDYISNYFKFRHI